jgi:isopenicillin N synthase-like dioxygenase
LEVLKMKIDVVDVQKSDAPRRFARSLHETGFAVLVNHPIPFDVVQRVWTEWLGFFKSEAKWEFAQNSGEQDGYRSLEGSELAVGAKVKDIKEYFHFYPWGRCPADLKESAALLYSSGAFLARTLLSWVEDESPLSVKEGFSMPLPNMLDDSHRTLLRILHYPPLKGDEPEGAVRAAAHEDINLLTVLPASNEPGLQVQSLDGSWFDVPCDPGSIAVNAGDMLAMASGGFFPSTTHRVLNPPSSSENRSRCSTPLFLHPADDVVLSVKDGKPYRAFDFLDDRLRAITGDGLRR